MHCYMLLSAPPQLKFSSLLSLTAYPWLSVHWRYQIPLRDPPCCRGLVRCSGGMPDAARQNVFRVTIIVRLLYASGAW